MKFFALLLVSSFLFFSSCNKDTSTERKISGEYKMNVYYINGFEATAFFNSIFPEWRINLKKSGAFTESFGDVSYGGDWNVSEKGEKLTLVQYNGEVRTYKIIDHDKQMLEVTQVDGEGNTNRFVLTAL